MENYSSMEATLLYVLLLGGLCNGARILGIYPTPFYSHQQPYQVIMKALAARGHHITVISPNPLKQPVDNYTDIDVSISYKYWRSDIDFTTLTDIQPIDTFMTFAEKLNKVTDVQLSSPQVQAFIRANATTFDLVILERLWYQAYYGLVHHLGSPPVIGVMSFTGLASSANAYGLPHNPSVTPNVMCPYTDVMTFWQRVYNTYVTLRQHYYEYYRVLPAQEAIMRKYFGSAPPSVYEANYNDSILLFNSNWILDYPKTLPPNMVELAGLHLQTVTKRLPKDIQDFLDGAEHGVVYFSLGSNVLGNTIPKTTMKNLQDAFSDLPQRVLWKWEAESMPGQPENVMLRKWLPQQDVLAHPNVRVFMTQAGLQSFEEATYHGVPLIGIPILGDQRYNVEKMVSAKVGVFLDFKRLSKHNLLDALGKILNDSSYHNNMKTLSAMYREQVGPSLDKAVWWVEYVLRYNGARHIRPSSLELSWYQYLLLDVTALFLVVAMSALVVSYIVVKKFISFLMKQLPHDKLKMM